MFRVPAFALVSATFFLVSYSMAEDWPQWRGQNRDNISPKKVCFNLGHLKALNCFGLLEMQALVIQARQWLAIIFS